jgi:hypothetical protein
MTWLYIALPILLIAVGIAVWWIRRSRRHRLISFVALLKEPASIDPAIVAQVAGQAWNLDLGDGVSQGKDGFVIGAGPLNTIMCHGQIYLVNSFPSPYVPDVEGAAEAIADLRIRSLFSEHRAWFSCDATGIDGRTASSDVLTAFRQLGRLMADLLDENCLLILVPDSQRGYPINDQTILALRSKNPLERLQETLTLPIVQVPSDDSSMKKAVDMANAEWPDRIYGSLGNDPGDLGDLKYGSNVSVPLSTLNDWIYRDRQGNTIGGFTITVLQKAAKKKPPQ